MTRFALFSSIFVDILHFFVFSSNLEDPIPSTLWPLSTLKLSVVLDRIFYSVSLNFPFNVSVKLEN